jgi:ribonuclease III
MVSTSMIQFNIKLYEAKKAIDIPLFKRDDLLSIALTDLSTLNQAGISSDEREKYTKQYRQLAILGDALFDAVLIDCLLEVDSELTQEDVDDYRKEVADRKSLAEFAITLGLPNFSSSWDKKNRKSSEEEPGVWGEMFEAVVGVIFIDRDRDFGELSKWLCDRFIRPAIDNEDYDSEDNNEYYCHDDWWDEYTPTYCPGENDD